MPLPVLWVACLLPEYHTNMKELSKQHMLQRGHALKQLMPTTPPHATSGA
jgi:hypothetical protein